MTGIWNNTFCEIYCLMSSPLCTEDAVLNWDYQKYDHSRLSCWISWNVCKFANTKKLLFCWSGATVYYWTCCFPVAVIVLQTNCCWFCVAAATVERSCTEMHRLCWRIHLQWNGIGLNIICTLCWFKIQPGIMRSICCFCSSVRSKCGVFPKWLLDCTVEFCSSF